MANSNGPAFRVAVNIDITGSMSSEIEGVKTMVSEFVDLLSNNNDAEVPLVLALLTFTENNKGCYVSLREFRGQELASAKDYVKGIRCSCPPDAPGVSASGEDGPENHKAALYRLMDMEPLPTIVFLITDAPPHMKSDEPCQTSRVELAWLQQRGVSPAVASDIFLLFNQVLQHYNEDQLVLNCVVYNGEAERGVYGSLAQRTGGMLMEPCTRTSATLAKGLMGVVKGLLSRLPGAPGAEAEQPQQLEGFRLYDTAPLVPRQTEQDPVGRASVGDNATIFNIAMERLVAVCGIKWTKRAIGMTAASEQLEFVWRAARYVTHCINATDQSAIESELARLLELREQIVSELPQDVAGHFSIRHNDLVKLAESCAVTDMGSGSMSSISLETVGEALAEDADWTDWLATVMRLLTGYPLQIKLPKDKLGRPDFMDAWSAVTTALGCDRMSAADFMRLLGGDDVAVGPTDRLPHNAFLMLADPKDMLATLVFKIASGTQVLNYISGIAMGAQGFLPNLHAGTAAACLMRLVSGSMSGFQRQQAAKIMHSLRSLHRSPAAAAARQLANGSSNPADSMSKLVAALVRLMLPTGENDVATSPATTTAIRLVLEEWAASIVQRMYGKGNDTDAAYLESLKKYIPAGVVLQGATTIDPLQGRHPLETDAVPIINDKWFVITMERLRYGCANEGLPPHPAVIAFIQGARSLLDVLLMKDGTSGNEDGTPGKGNLDTVWPEWKQGLLQALLLRYRTARYRIHQPTDSSTEIEWERVEVQSLLELLLGRLKEAYAGILRGYKEARENEIRRRLLEAATRVLEEQLSGEGEAETPEEKAIQALQTLFIDLEAKGSSRPVDAPRGPCGILFGQRVILDRTSVPNIFQKFHPGGALTASALRVLVLEGWTTTPPQALRNSREVLRWCVELGLSEVLKAMQSVAMCTRPSPCSNRHGHNTEWQYPGPCGWSSEYQAFRVGSKSGTASYVANMRKFTEMAADALRKAEALGVKTEMQCLLSSYEDANRIKHAQVQVNGVLGKSV